MCRRVLTRVFARRTRRFVTPSNHMGYLRLAKALIRLLRSADVQSQECAGWSVSSYKFYCRFCHAQTHARVVCANLNAKHPGYNFQQTFWNIFLILPREHYLHFMQIVSTAWNVKSCFLGNEKKKKKEKEFNLSSAELAQKMLSRRCAMFI